MADDGEYVSCRATVLGMSYYILHGTYVRLILSFGRVDLSSRWHESSDVAGRAGALTARAYNNTFASLHARVITLTSYGSMGRSLW